MPLSFWGYSDCSCLHYPEVLNPFLLLSRLDPGIFWGQGLLETSGANIAELGTWHGTSSGVPCQEFVSYLMKISGVSFAKLESLVNQNDWWVFHPYLLSDCNSDPGPSSMFNLAVPKPDDIFQFRFTFSISWDNLLHTTVTCQSHSKTKKC